MWSPKAINNSLDVVNKETVQGTITATLANEITIIPNSLAFYCSSLRIQNQNTLKKAAQEIGG